MKSTMNAPLTPTEERRILDAWNNLINLAPPNTFGNSRDIVEIPEMLAHATALIMAAHDLRRAISDGTYYANKRAFPDSHPRTRMKTTPGGQFDLATKLVDLGITEADINELIAERSPKP